MESVIELDEGRLAGEVTGFEEDSETGSSLIKKGGRESKKKNKRNKVEERIEKKVIIVIIVKCQDNCVKIGKVRKRC